MIADADQADRPDAGGRAEFPEGFLWGAATASYQVEGSPLADGAGVSIWHRFAHTPGNMVNDENGDVACDHYNRYRDDVALMRELGLTSYQFSIAWPRVLPEGTGEVNTRGLDFYDALVDALLEAGIAPMTCLFTWDLPAALQDRGAAGRTATAPTGTPTTPRSSTSGWATGVTHWLTMCEPMSIAHYGHTSGELAPGLRDIYTGLRVAHHLLLGHGRAVEALRASGAPGQIGIIPAMADIQPGSEDLADVAAAERTDLYLNALFLDPIMRGEYPAPIAEWFRDAWPPVADGDLELISTPIDFIGIDYYCRSVVADDPDGAGVGGGAEEIGAAGPLGAGLARMLKVRAVPHEGPVTGIGWPITPDGLGNCLRWLRRYDSPPIIITEMGAVFPDEVGPNGVVHDPERIAYIRDHLLAAHDAIRDGVDLRGCFIWSLTDTFEFNLGYDARFGLVRVDYDTQKRTIKDSGRWWTRVAAANGLPAEPASVVA